nr:hypothetical protein [uncultured Flavobacterium sp.]
MKKAFYVAAITTTVLLTSCSSGWNCKARYVKVDTQKKKQNERVA